MKSWRPREGNGFPRCTAAIVKVHQTSAPPTLCSLTYLAILFGRRFWPSRSELSQWSGSVNYVLSSKVLNSQSHLGNPYDTPHKWDFSTFPSFIHHLSPEWCPWLTTIFWPHHGAKAICVQWKSCFRFWISIFSCLWDVVPSSLVTLGDGPQLLVSQQSW